MYFSRVITGRIDPQRYDEAFSVFTDKIIPAAKEKQGFRGANLFQIQRQENLLLRLFGKQKKI